MTIRKEQKKLRVGVIGLGGAGRAHVRRLNRNTNISQVFGFDPKPMKGIRDVTIVPTREELFKNVDAVTICTPDHVHLEGIIAALQSGKHVLSEKPMVANLGEARGLLPYLKRYPKLVFGVHHQMRSVPAFSTAQDIINRRLLGRLFYIEANYWHNMRIRAGKFDNWRQLQGQSLIFGHGCHPLDLLMHLVNKTPISYSTYVSKNSFTSYHSPYTSATILLQFQGNLTGKIHVNSSCVYPQVNDLIVMGNKGTYIDGVIYTEKLGFRQLANFFGTNNWLNTEMNVTEINIPKKIISIAINAYLRIFNKLSKALMRETDFGFRRYPLSVYNHDFACQRTIDNFVSTILGHEKIITGYHDAVRVIELCELLEKQALATAKH